MDFDWKDLATKVIGLGAPMLGQALGGPLGGAAGKILAEALGSPPSPAAVNDGLAKSEAEAAALAQAGKAQVTQVGETMRAEAVSGDPLQRWWRPVYALELTLFECPGFAVMLGHGLWNGRSDIINGLATLTGLIVTYMAARFGVLGVYVTGRTREKQAVATGLAVPSVVGEIVQAIKNRK